MARIRTIKPEFFTSEQLAECSPTARLLFVGLLCFSDDGGVHTASAMRLKMEVFPADAFSAADVRRMLDELVAAGLVIEFQREGERFWAVTGWRHQRIDKPTLRHPQPSEEELSAIPPRPFGEDSARSRLRNGMEGNGMERKVTEGNGSLVSDVEGGQGGDPEISPSRAKATRSRKIPLPETWLPNAKHESLARELGVDLKAEAEAMCDWAETNAETCVNWNARFSTWLRRAKSFAPRTGGGKSTEQQRIAETMRAVETVNRAMEEHGFV